MLIFATDQELSARELMSCIMCCDHSLGRNDILKFIYCFMILFLTVYIFKHFLLLVSFSHQRSAIIFSFEFLLSFGWIRINIWIYINIRYFKISQHRVELPTSDWYVYAPPLNKSYYNIQKSKLHMYKTMISTYWICTVQGVFHYNSVLSCYPRSTESTVVAVE
jgi:hypothetical protein